MVITPVQIATAMSGTTAVSAGVRRRVATATAVSTIHQQPSVNAAHSGAVLAVTASRTTPAPTCSTRLATPRPRVSMAQEASLGTTLNRNPKMPLMAMCVAMPMRMSRVRQTA